MTLTFNERAHRYRLDGKPVPSVTTLIKGGMPAPQLIYWAARSVAEHVADNFDQVAGLQTMGRGPMVAALKETPWQKRAEAAVRGTEVHALAELVVAGLEVEVPEHLADHVENYTRWLDRLELAPVLVERPVANRQHWYAGRFDLVGDIRGVRWLLDVKTAKGVYPDNALQCDAYRYAEFYVDDEGTEQPMPQDIERIGVLHVRADATDLVPLRSDGEPYKDFLHCAWLARRDAQRKGYVGEPLEAPEPAEPLS